MPEIGLIYLICAAAPIGNSASRHGTARHYLGWTRQPYHRMEQHRKARPSLTKRGTPRKNRSSRDGARLCAAFNASRVAWSVSRTWIGTRDDERALKNYKKAAKLCPYCQFLRQRPTSWLDGLYAIPWPCNLLEPDDMVFDTSEAIRLAQQLAQRPPIPLALPKRRALPSARALQRAA